MHELGIVIQIVRQLESYMTEHDIRAIDTVVLEIGELSSVYPKYIEDVYPIAVEKTRLKDTKLRIDIRPGIGRCKQCGFAYLLIENRNQCPSCTSNHFSVITGREFMIKQILVVD
ncbi:MAG: hydrogenase maturation nickel metallochaperone HypA [Erysipelothrix sp.]|nr:hydrogenase maturation nickel metallochaperone HypA [Erysipelothrix sp.]